MPPAPAAPPQALHPECVPSVSSTAALPGVGGMLDGNTEPEASPKADKQHLHLHKVPGTGGPSSLGSSSELPRPCSE